MGYINDFKMLGYLDVKNKRNTLPLPKNLPTAKNIAHGLNRGIKNPNIDNRFNGLPKTRFTAELMHQFAGRNEE